MSLTERERGIAKAFGQAHRRYERRMSAMLFFVAFMSGLFGAYFGVHAVLSLFAAVTVAFGAQLAIVRMRKALGRGNA